MPGTVLAVFLMVYLGMILGDLPRLRIDRTGIALLGAIVLVTTGALTLEQAFQAVDGSTLALLFGLMVVSAQLRLGGFYTRAARKLGDLAVAPEGLLAALIIGAGALSAVFSNDIICLAATPILIEVCDRRRLNPVPFLLALACAANVGSAATLIGNPQNMLIGQRLRLSFSGYLLIAGPIAALGLVATWLVIAWQHRGRWQVVSTEEADHVTVPTPRFDRWQTIKGLSAATALLILFLTTSLPREVLALAAAGVLLTSQKLHSRDMLGEVDWQLLVLFIGLFVVNHALQQTPYPEAVVADLGRAGADPAHPGWLFGWTVVLSNLVSNVPAVMLLLPVTDHPVVGPLLAIASTFAGNLLIVGSIANIIVVEGAAQQGITIGWRQHAKTGLPVTALILLIAAVGLWARA